jgi:NAD(P)H-hydrate epimerase
MKILPVEKIREADAYTIANEPIADIELMERASGQLFRWLTKRVDSSHRFFVFAGPGNNGGDGMALSRLLTDAGYEVNAYVVRFSDKTSDSFQKNYDRFETMGKKMLHNLKEGDPFPEISEEDVVVDALFGSGLTRPVKGFPGEIIRQINQTPAMKIAIDIPSGLFADTSSKEADGEIVRADYTLSFQFPKLTFLLPENDAFVGSWHLLDIGLHPDFIKSVPVKNFYSTRQDLATILKPRKKFSHKGTYGHALLIAGSYGKMGAAILAAHAALRSGVGLLHVHIPKVGYSIMQTALPETMLSIDRYENYFSDIPELSMYNAIGVGPGLGTQHQSQMALKLLIQQFKLPIVFDADALNILAENKTWLAFLPAYSILAPHPKEFERLTGKWKDDFERLKKQREFAEKFQLVVVLKGAYTSICTPRGDCYFNSTGNPGMATAGSGDVLTGILTSLLAQGYASVEAAMLGVYLHGLAGDIAAKKLSEEAMIAGDIIANLGKAFKKLC